MNNIFEQETIMGWGDNIFLLLSEPGSVGASLILYLLIILLSTDFLGIFITLKGNVVCW